MVSRLIAHILGAILTLFIVSALTPSLALAQAKYWQPTSGNNWNTAANWSPSGVPTSANTVYFDSAYSTANCNIDVNVSVLGLVINSGYTGTITQNSTRTVTVGTGGYSQADGTFSGGDSEVSVDNFTLSGGTFVAPSTFLTVLASVGSSRTIFTFSGG
ncbi:MAG: hypothetical protein ACK5HO_06285, partial [Pseudomonadota bacterium]